MSEVKRYNLRQNMPVTALAFLPDVVVSATDYAALEAECERLRNSMPPAQRQRAQMGEWIPVSERLPADSRDVLVYCSDTDEHMVGSSMGCGRFAFAFSERGTRICCTPSHWRYIDECDKPAAIAASAGQEVK